MSPMFSRSRRQLSAVTDTASSWLNPRTWYLERKVLQLLYKTHAMGDTGWRVRLDVNWVDIWAGRTGGLRARSL